MTSVKDIFDSCRGTYLNDPSGAIYTDTKLLPLFKSVYGFLETALERNGVQCKNATFQVIVPAGIKTIPQLPGDFMWPVKMAEKLSGSTDLYQDMVQRRWEPQVLPTDKLIYWTWNGEKFQFTGATTDRDVLLYYWKAFPAVVDVNSYTLGRAEQYLTAKLAAVVHMFISQNPTLAQPCEEAAEGNLEEIIGIFVKKQTPVRRKPYIPFR